MRIPADTNDIERTGWVPQGTFGDSSVAPDPFPRFRRVSQPFLAPSDRHWLTNSLGGSGIGGSAAFMGFIFVGWHPRLLHRGGVVPIVGVLPPGYQW